MGWFAHTPVAAPILDAAAMIGCRRNRLRDFVYQPEPMERRSIQRPGNLQSGMALLEVAVLMTTGVRGTHRGPDS